jgi:transposase, IS5 family
VSIAQESWAHAPSSAAAVKAKSSLSAPSRVLKTVLKKLRYRGLAKNTAQLHTLFALANLVIVKKTLLVQSRA